MKFISKLTAVLAALAVSVFATSAAAQIEQVTNGSFESGLTGWTPVTVAGLCLSRSTTPGSAFFGVPSPTTAADGANFAEVYVQDDDSVCQIYQDVAIPVGSSAQLTLSAASLFNNGATGPAWNVSVRVTTTGGVPLTVLYTRDGTQAADGEFNPYSANLSAYAGQTVRIVAEVSNGAACCNEVFIDDVSLVTTPMVPTLTEWAMIGLTLTLAGAGVVLVRRRYAA